ncbi:MAG: Flp family type IVb pilin [Alphaproteobacteria bacterium]
MRAFLGDETGATAIEYGLILAFVILGIIVTIGLIGEDVLAMFTVDEQAFK